MNPVIKSTYKKLLKDVTRLPLDRRSLMILKKKTKDEFQNPSRDSKFAFNGVNSKKLKKITGIFDEILVQVNLQSIKSLLDLIYKQPHTDTAWIRKFFFYNSNHLKPFWPKHHLINELKSKDKTKIYNSKLREEFCEPISLSKFFNIDVNEAESNLKPLRGDANNNLKKELENIVDHCIKFHDFLSLNEGRLMHKKLQPIEVAYPTNRFGLPIPASRRNKLLLGRISYTKELTKTYIPICKSGLGHLISVVLTPSEVGSIYSINPYFFRYMRRKLNKEKSTLSNYSKHETRQKSVVPNDSNVKKILREYLMGQFTYDEISEKYTMSSMQDFYDTNEPISSEIEPTITKQ